MFSIANLMVFQPFMQTHTHKHTRMFGKYTLYLYRGGGGEITWAKPKYMGSTQEPCPIKRDYCINLRASIYLEKITESQNDELIPKKKKKKNERAPLLGLCHFNLFSSISTKVFP